MFASAAVPAGVCTVGYRAFGGGGTLGVGWSSGVGWSGRPRGAAAGAGDALTAATVGPRRQTAGPLGPPAFAGGPEAAGFAGSADPTPAAEPTMR